MSIHGSFDAVDQGRSSERLGQEANGSRLQRAGADALFGKGSDKDKRRGVPLGAHMGQKVQAAHSGHLHIRNDPHDESFKRADCKNASADANVSTRYPCEQRRLLVAVRTDASSSMTEITERVDKAHLPEEKVRRLPGHRLNQ
jgi:hypothetical protein